MPRQEQNRPLPNKPFEITISDIANGGDGIAKFANRTIFVPFTIPGEILTAQVVEDKGRFAHAVGVKLLDRSADRVIPECSHFGHEGCGGCQWQHMNYAAQLALKTDILLDQLERVAGFNTDRLRLQPAIPSPALWGYRTRADFVPAPDGSLGFWRNNGQGAMPIEECLIVHPDLMRLVDELDIEVENLAQLSVQISTTGDAMLTIRTTDEAAPELESSFPISVNFILNDNVPLNLVGKTHIVQPLLGKNFRVTAGVHFRDYPAQQERLIQVVLDYLQLRGEEAVLDAYAGTGVFSAFIAEHADYVTYIDSYPPAATDAEDNLAHVENVDIVEGAVEEILPDMLEDEINFDAIVLDPTLSGVSKDAMDAITAFNSRRIVYVSQEPSSFARDAKYLSKHGYRLNNLQPIDFAPQTASIQAVALFERSTKGK